MPEPTLPIVLIVIENGATWPRWVDRTRASVTDFDLSSRVLVQDDRELPARFAERVGAYVDHLENARISIAAIACCERVDDSALEARRMIGHHLARAMSKHARGRICFSEPKRASGRARHALSSLVSGLEQHWADSGLEIGVRFSTESELAPRVA